MSETLAGSFPVPPVRRPAAPARTRGYWGSVWRRLRYDYVTLFCLALILLIVASAVFAPWLAPVDPYKSSMTHRLKPVLYRGDLLGTDEQGRDMLSRLLYGGRVSLTMGILPVALATVVGGLFGVVAGFYGGKINTAIMRTMDVFFAFPSVLLAVAISGSLGGGLTNQLLTLTVVLVPPLCRVAETATAQVRSMDFVDAARSTGAPTLSILVTHVLINVMSPVLVYASTLVSVSIILASGLSFLGLGVSPPTADWGLMLSTLRQSIYVQPLVSAMPGIAILVTSVAFNLVSDGLRQAMDVRGVMQAATALAPSTPAPDPRDRGGPAQPMLIVQGFKKSFPIKAGLLNRTLGRVRAVDDVSFVVVKGETLGVVGESGCGKSTLARLLMHLLPRDEGSLILDGDLVGDGGGVMLDGLRRSLQMVFQDSASSLNPRLPVEQSIAYGPRVQGAAGRSAKAQARALMEKVGLNPSLFGQRYPHELSGGQKQRVNIARALALAPRLLILDEAVSALDKSVEAQVLNLLADLKRQLNLTYLFISHDLHVVRYISDRVLVMYLGQVVEIGPVEAIYEAARHPYTQALLACRLSMDPEARVEAAPLAGDPPSPVHPPPGCRFHTRCPFVEDVCRTAAPALGDVLRQPPDRHLAACHMVHAGSGHSRAPAAP